MKTLVAAALLAVLASPSGAQGRWVVVDSSPRALWQFDFDRLRRESANVIDVWYEILYVDDQQPIIPVPGWKPYRRRLADSYFDCVRLQEMLLSEIFYADDGGAAGRHNPPTAQRDWVPVAPGTIHESVALKACDVAKSRNILPHDRR